MSSAKESDSSAQDKWFHLSWGKFLVFALVLLLIVLLFQSCSFTNSRSHQRLKTSPVSLTIPNTSEQLTYKFTVSYPEKILIEEGNTPARFIMVSVAQTQPFTAPVTFTVKLHPQKEGVLFSNAEGKLLSPELSLAPNQSGKIYVSRQPLATPVAVVPISVTCANNLTPTKNITLIAFNLNLQNPRSAAFWRFLDLLLGPTTILLAVVSTLIALGLKSWGEEEKRRGEEDRKRIDKEEKEKEAAERDREKEKENAYKEYKRTAEEETRKRKAKEEKTELAKIGVVQWSPFLTLNTLRLTQSRNFEWFGLTGLKFNPFYPNHTELDARTANYTLLPPIISSTPSLLQAPTLTAVFGNSGNGKTAAARWLGYNCNWPPGSPTIPQTLSVYCPLALPEQSNTDCFAHFTYAIAQTLIAFFAVNRYIFILLPDDQKLAVLELLIHTFGSIDTVTLKLEQTSANLPEHELQKIAVTPEKVRQGLSLLVEDVSAIHEKAEPLSQAPFSDRTSRLRLLSAAKLLGFETIYLLADVKLTDSNEQTLQIAVEYLQTLLDYEADLSSIGIYVKLFLPTQLQSYLHLPSHVPTEIISWSDEELEKLLEMRVQAAGLYSVRQLFLPRDVPSPEKTFIKIANAYGASPREMLNFGNQLIIRHITQSPAKPTISGKLFNDLKDEFLKNAKDQKYS